MKRGHRLWIVAFGIVLLAPEAWYRVRVWISEPVKARDARVAFEKLAGSPLRRVGDRWMADLDATIPSGETWDRIRRNWGDPGYVVVAAPSGTGEHLYCLNDLELNASAVAGGEPLALETAEFPPYGYSADCRPVGLLFRAPPGTVVRIRVWAQSRLAGSVDLAVRPYWTSGTKDRLVGVALEKDLRLTANILAAVGAVAVSLGGLFFFLPPPVEL